MRNLALKLLALAALMVCGSANAEVWTARYGVAETFNFKLYNADGTLDVDEADGGTEVSLSCNEGAQTTATNDFVDEGDFYSIALTAAEMQCERIAIVVAATTTEVFFIQTVGNASALTPFMPSDVQQFGGSAGTFAGGRPEVNTSHFGGTAGTFASGRPEVNTSHWGGTAVGSTTVNANVTQVSGDSGAADELELAFDGAAGAVESMGVARQGTAQSATGTTLVMDAGAAFADDTAIGMTLVACGSTQGYCQARVVTDNVLSTDTLTVDPWTVTPSGTVTFYLFSTAPGGAGGALTAADVWSYATRTVTSFDEDSVTLDLDATIRAALGVATANLDTQLTNIDNFVDTEVAEILDDTGTSGVVLANDAITSAKIAADAIGSSELAASAVNELRDLVIEDQGGGVTLGCAIAVILAYASGDLVTTGSDSTYEEPSGTETRAAGTVTSVGNRTATITCPTY